MVWNMNNNPDKYISIKSLEEELRKKDDVGADFLLGLTNTIFTLDSVEENLNKNILLSFQNREFMLADLYVDKPEEDTEDSNLSFNKEEVVKQLKKLSEGFSTFLEDWDDNKKIKSTFKKEIRKILENIDRWGITIYNLTSTSGKKLYLEEIQKKTVEIKNLMEQFGEKAEKFNFDGLLNLVKSTQDSNLEQTITKMDEFVLHLDTVLKIEPNKDTNLLEKLGEVIEKISSLDSEESKELNKKLLSLATTSQSLEVNKEEIRQFLIDFMGYLTTIKNNLDSLGGQVGDLRKKLSENDETFIENINIRRKIMEIAKDIEKTFLSTGSVNLEKNAEEYLRRIEGNITSFLNKYEIQYKNSEENMLTVSEFYENTKKLIKILLNNRKEYKETEEEQKRIGDGIKSTLVNLKESGRYFGGLEKIKQNSQKIEEIINYLQENEKKLAGLPDQVLKKEVEIKISELKNIVNNIGSENNEPSNSTEYKENLKKIKREYAKIAKKVEAIERNNELLFSELEGLLSSKVIHDTKNLDELINELEENVSFNGEETEEFNKKVKENYKKLKRLLENLGKDKIILSDDLYQKFSASGFPEVVPNKEISKRFKKIPVDKIIYETGLEEDELILDVDLLEGLGFNAGMGNNPILCIQNGELRILKTTDFRYLSAGEVILPEKVKEKKFALYALKK